MGRAWWGWLHGERMEALTAQMVSSPQKQRGPQKTGGHPHKGTHLPPCFRHGAPHHPLRCPTYSSLFTTPLPLGSKRRKALRMASSGSVPGRPREPGEHPHRQLPSPTEEEPGVREGTFHITERGEGTQYKVLLGAQRSWDRLFLKWQAWPGGWDWGFGSESEGIFPSPEAWGDQCLWNAEVGPTSSGWARARWGLDRLWVGFRLGPSRVQVECTLAAQPGTPDLPRAHH